jgi:uncharacterized protein (DUF2141 family)
MKFIFFTLLFSFSAVAAPLKITFSQTMGKTGKILFGIFDSSAQFPKGTAVKTGSVAIGVETEISAMVDLPVGEYAISVFLDENNNGRLDQNMLGIPRERFGFSNNPRILTGAPSYRDCAVRILDQDNELDIRLIKLL